MSQPIAKWMPDKASYRPYAMSPFTPRKARILALAAKAWDGEIQQFARDLDAIQLTSLHPNKTGRKVSVRARFGSKSVGFSVFPYEGGDNDYRTFRSLLEEVAGILLKKLKVPCHDGKSRGVTEAVGNAAKEMFEAQGLGPDAREYFGSLCAKPMLVVRVKALVLDGGGFGAFFKAVTTFVRNGGLDADYDRHQTVRALEQYKTMALHALRHGARLDDMQTILDEAVVQVTLEC